jgi:hypothetical protein
MACPFDVKKSNQSQDYAKLTSPKNLRKKNQNSKDKKRRKRVRIVALGIEVHSTN